MQCSPIRYGDGVAALTTASALLLMLLLTLQAERAAAIAAVTIATRYPDNVVPAAALWDGGEMINLTISGNSWNTAALDADFGRRIFSETGGSPSARGPESVRELMFPPNDAGYIVESSATFISLRLRPAPGIAITTDVMFGVSFSGTAQQQYLAATVPLPAAASFTVSASVGGGTAAFSSNTTNEFEVRVAGVRLRAQLRYNAFAAPTDTDPVVTSSRPELSTGWSFAFTNPFTLEAYLLPNQAFDLPAGEVATLTLDISAVPVVIPGVAPATASFVLDSVNDAPVAFCIPSVPTITEAELREGPQNISIRFDPPSSRSLEEFLPPEHTLPDGNTVAQTWASSIAGPSAIALTLDFAATEVNATLAADPAFETNTQLQISFSLPPTVLKSGEAGCGVFAILIVPAAGTATGLNITDVTEVVVNEEGAELLFALEHDVFVAARAMAVLQARRIVLDPPRLRGITRGADTTIAGSMLLNVSNDGREARVRIPATSMYNIPDFVVEEISIFFTANSTASNIAPLVLNGSFNITGVVPTIAAALNTTGSPLVPIELLWSGFTVFRLRIRGDIWDPNGRARWNVYHPTFSGAFQNTNFSFSAFHTILNPVVRYGDVSLNGRDAYLPVQQMLGFALPFDERVSVADVTPMIEGPDNAIIARTSLSIVRVNPANVFVFFGGHAEPSMTIRETDVRRGLHFSIRLQNGAFAPDVVVGDVASLFPEPRSLQPFLHKFEVVLATFRSDLVAYYRANFTLPPLEDYDISVRETIDMVVPASWFLFTSPTPPATAAIQIDSEPSPGCTLRNFPLSGITEGDIRASNVIINVEVTEKLVPELMASVQNRSLNFTVDSRHHESAPLQIELTDVGVFSLTGLDRLTFTIRQDASYEINSADSVAIALDRRFFTVGEACLSPINFTIGALPGIARLTVPRVNETQMRGEGAEIIVSLQDDHIRQPAFNLTIVIERDGGVLFHSDDAEMAVPGRNIRELFNPLVLTAVGVNSTYFVATIPPLPTYDIFSQEVVRFIIPVASLESGNAPMTVNNTLIIDPAPGELDFTLNATVMESEVSQGGQQIVFDLRFELWDTEVVRQRMHAALLQRIVALPTDSVTREGLSRVFGPGAFSLRTNSTLVITMQQDPSFDIVHDLTLEISVPPNVTASKFVPSPSAVQITITAQPGVLVASGPGLLAGSRELVLGGVQLTLTLLNDLFVKQQLSPRELCPVSLEQQGQHQLHCDLLVDEPSAAFTRVVVVQFPNRTDFVLFRNTSYLISVPATTIKSGLGVNDVSMTIFLQAGVLEPVMQLVGREFSEDQFRDGLLPSIEFRVVGDRFVGDGEEVVAAIARGLRCSASADAFGFCARASSLLRSGFWSLTLSNRRFVVQPQADPDFDVVTEQTVEIAIAGTGLLSRFAPVSMSPQTFRIRPSTGSYFFSSSMVSVPSSALANGFEDDPSRIIEIVLTLHGERWRPNPTHALVEGFTSSSPAQSEPHGFMRRRHEMFFAARVSSNQRTLRIAMRRTPQYNIAQPETISFGVSGLAVLSGVPPTLGSQKNILHVEPTAPVKLLSARVIPLSALVAEEGVNVTIHLGNGNEFEQVTSRMFADALQSQSPPALEPQGFEAFRQLNLIDFRTAAFRSSFSHLHFVIRAMAIAPENRQMHLREREVLRLTVPPSWVVSRLAPYPQHLDITLEPSSRAVILIVEGALDPRELVRRLAQLLGTTRDTLVVEHAAPLQEGRDGKDAPGSGDGGEGSSSSEFWRVRLVVEESNVVGARPVDDTVDFLLTVDESIIHDCCGVRLSFLASVPQSDEEISRRIGLVSGPQVFHRDMGLTWVWIVLGACGAAIVAAAMYYLRVVRASQLTGMHRTLPADADAFEAKLVLTYGGAPGAAGGGGGGGGGHAGARPGRLLDVARKDGDRLRADDFAATIEQSVSLKALNRLDDSDNEGAGDGEGADAGMPCFAGRTKSKIRIDVDETLRAGQPGGFLERQGAKRQLLPPPPPPPPPPLRPEEVATIFPPGTSQRPKFAPPHACRPADNSML